MQANTFCTECSGFLRCQFKKFLNFPSAIYIEVPISSYCRELVGEILQVLLYFLNSCAKMENWPLTRLCEWNWRLCMHSVVVHTRNCQILTGANICMVSYLKIFTSIRLTRHFCMDSFLLFCFCLCCLLSFNLSFLQEHLLVYIFLTCRSITFRTDYRRGPRYEDSGPHSSQSDGAILPEIAPAI